MPQHNPFVYPESMIWLPFIASALPGTMIWVALENVKTGEPFFAFVIREETTFINMLPQIKTRGVPLKMRMGLMPIELPTGKSIPMVIIMFKLPVGLVETTVNALKLDAETLRLARQPYTMFFVGDSGSVERSLVFPKNKKLAKLLQLSRDIYEQNPWTDREFDQAKVIYEANTDMHDLWREMGRT